jgi:hypothetical protein
MQGERQKQRGGQREGQQRGERDRGARSDGQGEGPLKPRAATAKFTERERFLAFWLEPAPEGFCFFMFFFMSTASL